jgi:hypothetical protein
MTDGIHVLYMHRNVKPALQDFAAARDKVLSDYRNDGILCHRGAAVWKPAGSTPRIISPFVAGYLRGSRIISVRLQGIECYRSSSYFCSQAWRY